MGETKFTKGEWKITRTQSIDADYGVTGKVLNLVIGDYSYPMAVTGMACTKEINLRYQEAQANVSLIAAAPELYDMLQKILDEHVIPTYKAQMAQDVIRILKKARGEE